VAAVKHMPVDIKECMLVAVKTLPWEEWVKLYFTCHHCREKVHIHPMCPKYLAAIQSREIIPKHPCKFYDMCKKPLVRQLPGKIGNCKQTPQNFKDPKAKAISWLGNPLGILWNSAIIQILELLNSRIFIGNYFSNPEMCSHQFGTRSHWFGILSCHQFFQFHESENIPAIFVSGKWHQISRLNAPTLFARTIAITLLTISTQYTQIYEKLIDLSRYRHLC
jgi:hypothetical protein